MNDLRRDSPAGTGGRGFLKSCSSRRHAKACAVGGETRGTGVAPDASGGGLGRESALPLCALRNRPKAVSDRPRDEDTASLGGRDESASKSSLRSVGAARKAAPSSRRRLPSIRSRVVTAARNLGVATIPGGALPRETPGAVEPVVRDHEIRNRVGLPRVRRDLPIMRRLPSRLG